MKVLVLLISLSLFTSEAFPQQALGLRINAGLSQLKTELDDEDISQKFYFMFSGLAGIYGHFPVTENSFIGTELLYNRIAGKEELVIKWDLLNGGPGTQEVLIYTYARHISYLSIPLYYGYVSDKFVVRGGFQFSMPLESGETFKYKVPYNIQVLYTEPDRLDIEKYDYGIMLGLAYKIDAKTEFEFSYYHGLNDIYDGSDRKYIWKNRQLLAGFRYTLFSSQK